MKSDFSYLFLLKEPEIKKDERISWGMNSQNGIYPVAVGYGLVKSGTLEWKQWKNTQWEMLAQLGFSSPWILVFYSDESNPKSNLKRLVKNSNVRIWHHGGELNLHDITMDKVCEKFNDNGFFAAGFSKNVPLMPFSSTTPFLWQNGISKVRDELFHAKTLDLYEALNILNSAWIEADVFFHLERPIKKIIESLFTLYIDLRNSKFHGFEEADFQLENIASYSDIKSALSSLGLGQDKLEYLLNDFCKYPQRKPLAEAGLALLTAKTGLTLSGAEDFIHKFKVLSEAYTQSLGILSDAESAGLTDSDSP